MSYLWEGTLAQKVELRRNYWRDKKFIDEDLIAKELPIPPYFLDYYQRLKEGAQILLEANGDELPERSLALLDIDARLSFMVNELAIDPTVTEERYKVEEQKYYQSEYLRLEAGNNDTLLCKLLHGNRDQEYLAG